MPYIEGASALIWSHASVHFERRLFDKLLGYQLSISAGYGYSYVPALGGLEEVLLEKRFRFF